MNYDHLFSLSRNELNKTSNSKQIACNGSNGYADKRHRDVASEFNK